MQAAVIRKLGDTPEYIHFPDPELNHDDQLLMIAKTASLKNLDKLLASGKHFASHQICRRSSELMAQEWWKSEGMCQGFIRHNRRKSHCGQKPVYRDTRRYSFYYR